MFGFLVPSPATLPISDGQAVNNVTVSATDTQSRALDVLKSATDGSLLTNGTQLLGTSVTADGPKASYRFNGRSTWIYQVFNQPRDWSSANSVTITLRNNEAFPVTIVAIFSASPNPGDLSSSYQAPFEIPANTTKRFNFVLSKPDIAALELRDLPPPAGSPSTNIWSTLQVDRSRIGHWRLSYQGTTPARIDLVEMNLNEYKSGFPSLIDEYGQLNTRDWPKKIKSDNDLWERLAEEDADLAQNPPSPSLRGSVTHPNSGVSTNWRLSSINGKKYFVTPGGKPFWMVGLSGVDDGMATMVGRGEMFNELPVRNGAYSSLYTPWKPVRGAAGETFSIQRYNVMRKYGSNYSTAFVNRTKQRLSSWGINTIGAFADFRYLDNSSPFTMILNTDGYPKRVDTPMVQWSNLPDPYGNDFETWAAASFSKTLGVRTTYSNLVGVFVDNEMSWGMSTPENPDGDLSIAVGAILAPETVATHNAIISMVTAKYGIVSRLNAAWGTNYLTFRDVKTLPPKVNGRYSAAVRTDLSNFVGYFSDTYFMKVKKALTSIGYKGLYLGCRFFHQSDTVVQKAAKYADVLSFNYYTRGPQMPWNYLNSLSKPVMISETSVAYNDEGAFAGNPLAGSKAQRAEWATELLNTLAVQPNVVGMIWFDYCDMPATGHRDTKEQYGLGLIDIADTPDTGVINAFRNFTKNLYQIRG